MVWAWSSEKQNVGINAGPSLDITYTVTDSLVKNLIIIGATVAGAVLAGIPLSQYIYNHTRQGKIDKQEKEHLINILELLKKQRET